MNSKYHFFRTSQTSERKKVIVFFEGFFSMGLKKVLSRQMTQLSQQ
jgi:hypothetical protein